MCWARLESRIIFVFSRLFPTEKSDPELAPFRSGLFVSFFNAFTWQIVIGTPMVLFAEALGATPAQVGLAYSFVFLLTPVQIVAAAYVSRYGFKRVTLTGWSIRTGFLVAPIVLTALAAHYGARSWMATALIWSVFFFCLCRAIGASAIISWLYALLPEKALGRYFANDHFVSGVSGVATLLASAALFAFLPLYVSLLVQYVIALTGSTLGLLYLRRLPDVKRPPSISLWAVLRETPRRMFAPGVFRRYLWLAGWYYVLSTPIPPFAAYYLKVGPGFGAGKIMLFEVVRYLGVIVAAWSIRRRIDEVGARPFLVMALALYAVVAVFWLLFLHSGVGGVPGVFIAYFVLGIGATCWTVANLNYLPQTCGDADRSLLVSIHGAVTTCLGGCSPVVWGWFLKPSSTVGMALSVPAFAAFFVFVLVSATVLWVLIGRLPEDRHTPVEPLMIGNAVLRPMRAVTYLVNLIDLRK